MRVENFEKLVQFKVYVSSIKNCLEISMFMATTTKNVRWCIINAIALLLYLLSCFIIIIHIHDSIYFIVIIKLLKHMTLCCLLTFDHLFIVS